ncbi:thrombospondin type-1 domain-containing protein 7A-like isoform X2 [Ptychodera flava]|uniref:thrombospondin type-1 domain-containing protein 7A-like isoform X2 n=1 Tax=Ptychodera flava TaxID=63121 RepID=UPI00396A0504
MMKQRSATFYTYLVTVLTLVTIYPSTGQHTETGGYIWKTGSWGKCRGNHCGFGGVKTRSAWCIHSDGWDTIKTNCNQTIKPTTQQRCFKVCDGHRYLFEWITSDWSICQRSPDVSPTITSESCGSSARGIQNRTVFCQVKTTNILIDQQNGVVDDSFCEHFSHKPAISQSCRVPCPQDCIVTHFSDWSSCSKTCGNGTQTQSRRILVPPLFGGKPCPELTKAQMCKQLPPCVKKPKYTYKTKVGPWTSCKPMDDGVANSSIGTVNQAVIGYQSRQVTCIRNDGQNVYMGLCSKHGGGSVQSSKACVISQDCLVSKWSDWSGCSQTCIQEDGSLVGYRTRQRDVVALPLGDGQHCPHLQETQHCAADDDGIILPCPRYRWHISAWGQCHSEYLLTRQESKNLNFNDTLCGGGLQFREAFCVQENDTSYRPVDTEFCSPPQPSYIKECSVLCPQHCIVSEWSEWGMCSIKNCLVGEIDKKEKGHRSRTRKVIQMPLNGGIDCPPLVESKSCDEPVCYFWHTGEYSPCTIRKANKKCGNGKMSRKLTCVDVNMNEMNESLCADLESKPESEIHCRVPCADDCVVEEWSAWTDCSKSCLDKNSTVGIQKRHRTILAHSGKGGHACPAKDELSEERTCNELPCNSFTWRNGPWGDCITDSQANPNNTMTLNQGMCDFGFKSRLVYCSKTDGDKKMPDRKCIESVKPLSKETCQVPCPNDCVVTKFSEWTACPTTCIPGEKLITTQHRRRYILYHGTPGGKECPDTLYESRDCENLPSCHMYDWNASSWSDCVLPRDERSGDEERCGDGLQVRDVSCVREDGETVDIDLCLKYAGKVPEVSQSCRVHCTEDCTLSEWSKFGKCSSECEGQKTRKRKLIGSSRRREECQNNKLFPVIESQSCTCPNYTQVTVGNWSDCILPFKKIKNHRQNTPKGALNIECGEGKRYQRVICINSYNQEIVSNSLCSQSEDDISIEFIEETCNVACPVDCKLSSWSTWTECSRSCGTGMRSRERYLKERSHGAGRQCPHIDENNKIEEREPCYSDCSHYIWIAHHWKECDLYDSEDDTCGKGWQHKTVRCVLRQPGKEDIIVDDSFCDKAEEPSAARICLLPCNGDCVVSDWSPWSLCSHPCNTSEFREQTRYIVRQPRSDGAACPNLNNSEPCLNGISCFDYHWNITEWSTCRLNDNAICGNGLKTRKLDCIRSDGRSVSFAKCEQFALNTKPGPLEEPCHLVCPMDCQMSNWSPWSQCSMTCGHEGISLRQRHIVREANQFGRYCPTDMIQQKPCALQPCYHWIISDWSICQVKENHCGRGVRRRNITCRQDEGVVVDVKMCYGNENYHSNKEVLQEGYEMMQIEEKCTIPCPGDCEMSGWSAWSPCHQVCIDGQALEDMEGIQTRSKALLDVSLKDAECKSVVWQTRPCQGGVCFEYEWKVSDWDRNGFRHVWCQRSDQINVTGGCLDWLRPSSERRCHPKCTVPHSMCTDSGVCSCEEGYIESYSVVNGFLEVCLRPSVEEEEEYTEKVNTYAIETTTNADRASSEFKTKSTQSIPDMLFYGAVAAGSVFVVLAIIVIYIACRITRKKKAKRRLQQEKERYWDTSAKRKYNSDIDL